MEEKDFEKKPKKKVGLIITVVVLVLVALIVAGGFVYLKFFNNKPQKIFEKAISKAFEMTEKTAKNEGKLDIELSASLNSTSQDMMMANTYLQMIKLNLTTEFNMDKKVLNQGISVSAFDEPVISVEGLIQDNNIYFLLNNIYSKYIQVPSEEMEGVEPNEIFNTENIEVSEKLVKELKQILLDEVNSKELTQENVEVDGDKLTKTTVKFTAKEIEQIITKLTEELYKISPVNDVKNIVEGLEQIEIDEEDAENDNYLEISIYTKRLTGKIVKTEIAMINVADNEAIVVTIAEKEDEKVEITFAMNEDSIATNKAVTMFTLTIKEEGENKGTVTLKANIDEAASSLRIEIDSMPEEIDIMSRQKVQLEIEREALKKEDTNPDCERKILEISQEISDLEAKIGVLKEQWNKEKATIQGEASIKEEIEQVKLEIEKAERNTDLQKAAELKYGKLMELQKKLEDIQGTDRKDNQLLKEEIDGDDIAEVVSKWTGVPVSKLVESEMKKLISMEDVLHKRLIGQDEAVNTVSDAIRRARSGLKDPKRPIGTFIFLGPTGVGKTELAKSLADFMFNDEDAIVRIDMSEYMEKHNVARLVGAPPGYVGYDEGGQLTEAVRRKPYSVVLFDEIEKAHPDVFNLMLQIFDDGRLTDSKGRTVDFKNTLIIMTSNIGSEVILEDSINGDFSETKEKVMNILKERFKPEFLNRVDETIFFKGLTLDNLKQIVDIQMESLGKRLGEQEINLEVTPDAKELLATQGYNPIYGARPLKRTIRQMVENPLAKLILAQKFIKGDTLVIDAENDEIKFKRKSK